MSEVIPTNGEVAVTPGGLMRALVDLASKPDFDIEKFKVLADLQLRMEDRQAERLLTQDLQLVQKRIPPIPKRGVIDLGNKGKIYFATLPDVMRALQPLLDEYGMTISRSMIPAGDKLISRTTLRHPAGATMSVDMVLPVDTGPGRNSAQAHMSSETYGGRRGIKAMFNIQDENQGDDDGASANYKTLTEEQVTELLDLLKIENGSEAGLLNNAYGDRYRGLEEAPAADYFMLKSKIEQRNRGIAKKREEAK